MGKKGRAQWKQKKDAARLEVALERPPSAWLTAFVWESRICGTFNGKDNAVCGCGCETKRPEGSLPGRKTSRRKFRSASSLRST